MRLVSTTESGVTEDAIAATENAIRAKSATRAEIEIAKLAIFRRAEYTTIGRDGREVIDAYQVKQDIFDAILEAEANDREERKDVAISRSTLMAKLFDDYPEYDSEEWHALDVFTRNVWNKVTEVVWRMIDTKAKGTIQRWAGEDHDGLVVIKTEVGKDGVPSVYVTRSPKLFFTDHVTPMADKVALAAEGMAGELSTFVQRNRELEAPTRRAVKRAIKDAGTRAEAVLLLNAGTGDEDEESGE